MSNQPAPRNERRVIGHYEILKRVGAGGMGAVYKARHTDLGRMVAFKTLPPELASKPEMLERFRLEAQHAAKLRHENIVTLYEFGETNHTHFLAMEFVDGCNLHEYIHGKGKLDPEEARLLTIQAARALACAHEQNIVHRDIKPSNFLLTTNDGRPVLKLTDFGLARTMADTEGNVTRSGTTVGTVDYISPEQARYSRSADIRSDIYSLGCTLYHMLAGRAPFIDGDVTERLLKHVEAEPPEITKFNPKVPPELVFILKKMLAKKPEHRYQTPNELLHDLINPPKMASPAARAALELLAEASGEKARAPRHPAPQRPGKQPQKPAAPSGSMPASPSASHEIRLRYRKQSERRKRPEEMVGHEETMAVRSPVVLEGIGAWLIALGSLAVVSLIGLAIAFNWGGQPSRPKSTDQASTEPTSSKQEPDRAAKPTTTTEKMGQDVKKASAERRDGEDLATSREATQALQSKEGALKPIEEPEQNVKQEMAKMFPQKQRGAPVRNQEEVRDFFGGQPVPEAKSDTLPIEPKGQAPDPAARVVPIAPEPSRMPNVPTPAPTNNNPPRRAEPSPQPGSPPPAVPIILPTPVPTTPARQPPVTREPPPQTKPEPKSPKPGPAPREPDRKPEVAATAPNKPATQPGREMPAPRPAPMPGPQTIPTRVANQPNPNAPAAPAPSQPAAPSPSQPAIPLGPEPVVVRRDARGSRPGQAGTIAQAIAMFKAAYPGKTVVVDLQDNGPLFESPIDLKNQSLILRAAPGYRPLVALDFESASAGTRFLLSIDNGNLVLENVDLVLKVPEALVENDDVGLIRMRQGNMLVDGCTFSIAGRSRSGATAIRIDKPEEGAARYRSWLRGSVFRGANIVAVDVRAPNSEIKVDNCLMVGQEKPLWRIRVPSSASPAEVGIAHSTLVANRSLFGFAAPDSRAVEPAIKVVAWDSVLARANPAAGGEMLAFPAGVASKNVSWRATNCLYAGWQSLLDQDGAKLESSNLAAWHEFTHQPAGDKAIPQSWPPYLPPEIERLQPAVFRVYGSAAAFRDSLGQGTIGCPVEDLPATRSSWLSYTYERALSLPLEGAISDQAPEIPMANDGLYHGGTFNVTSGDLGERLQELQEARQLASRVVIHLTGKGTATMTPVRLRGVNLVLYADPAGSKPTLTPKPGTSADALISIENGSCDLIGVGLALAPPSSKASVDTLVQTRNAHLRVFGCRVRAIAAPAQFRSIFRFQGSKESAPEQMNQCLIADSVLQSSASALRVTGNGFRLRIQDSLIVTGEDAIEIDPGSVTGPINSQCDLEHVTLAVRKAALRVHDIPAGSAPLEPMPVVVRACVFVSPFADKTDKSGLLVMEDRALGHGLASWQADGNVYHKVLSFSLTTGSPGNETDLATDAAARLWGPEADRRGAVVDLPQARDFRMDKAPLERLALPDSLRTKYRGVPPGADLDRLGLTKRSG